MEHIYRNGTSTWGSDITENEQFERDLAEIIFQEGHIIADIGCGKNKIADHVIGIDPYAEDNGIDIKAYMWELPFKENSLDSLLSFDSLEHISKYQVIPTLREWRRVLKQGGHLVIVVPDFIQVMKEFIIEPDINWRLDTIFGTQLHEGEFHKTGFTVQFIQEYLFESGFLNTFVVYKINAYHQANIAIITEK